MTLALGLTLVLIYLVLASLFESYSQPWIILTTVPLGAIGVVGALWVAKQAVNIGALMGAIMLGGIVVNNAIILIDGANRLQRAAGYHLSRALLAAGTDRLRPICMTTLTTILGLLPMALSRTEESTLWTPLAITVIGGLTLSTVFTLLVVPAVTLAFRDVGLVTAFTRQLPIRLWKPHTVSSS